ncbi:hypothetical protein QEZ54_29960 [Catellatospora sp. KI3]|uniref:hypothetical protein n=1 Tax=Catellatospora sp. KI3 TaxID=3041620 RepID=UPI00248329AD|nr:hypothetical protein [Catellatospora sp. KI3]MDI1465202.1 hypothetical protein [Catellatospora sp. KI3]
MSLFGYFVIARHPRPLYELPAVQRLCRESDEEFISPGTLANLRAEGDWQLLQVLGGWSAELADELAAQTAAPAMSIYVVESAFGIIEARTAEGGSWQGYLNPRAAVQAYGAPPPPELDAVVAAAVAWAADTGHPADAGALPTALQGRVGPFGEGVNVLVEALGFRFGAGEELPDD